jgi:branched-chain amino acid transport system substrate-binding protein
MTFMTRARHWALAAAAMLFGAAGSASAQDEIFVGILDDTTGATAQLGVEFAAAKRAALDWVNAHGGVNDKKIAYEAVDYGYKAPAAITIYKRWTSGSKKPALIFGYGTADTEALTGFTNDDKIPFLSHSFSAKLTDPEAKSGKVDRGTPYNFFHGPSYSDGCRAVVTWAMDDWKSKGQSGKPKFVFMGDNHPFPNSPKEACLAAAEELGFEMLPAIQYSLRPGDFKAQCLTLRESGAHYAYLANTGDGNVALLKSCATLDVKAKFLTNIWGYSEIVMNAVGEAANGVVMPLHVKPWGTDAPGMKLVSDIAEGKPRSTYYIAAVCTIFYAKEAMEWADKNGGITGENVRKGLTQQKDWVPKGLEGMCAPATWTEDDHRSVVKVDVVEGVISNGKAGWKPLTTVDLGRDAKWWGR